MELTMPKKPIGKPMYTVQEVAQLAGVSKGTVYEEIRRGNLQAVVRRGCTQGYRIRSEALDRWIDEQWTPVR